MALLRTPVAVAVAPLPVAMAVLKPPLAVAVVFGPIPIARSPRSVVVQVLPPVPEPLLKPPADAQLALASPAELSAPMANAPDASAPSSTPPPSRTQSLPPARTALCLPMICLASDIASLLVVAGHGGYGLDLRMIDLPWRRLLSACAYKPPRYMSTIAYFAFRSILPQANDAQALSGCFN